jgi:hypothetical protein
MNMEPVGPMKVGRKPKSERHATAIQEAEGKFADKLPLIADMALDMAMGTKPETCPIHKATVMTCPHEDPVMWVDEEGVMRISTETTRCDIESKGFPANERMMVYVMNRVAGIPTVRGERQVQLEFVRKVTKHIADLFKSINDYPSPEERANNFAMGIAQLWVLIGEGQDE